MKGWLGYKKIFSKMDKMRWLLHTVINTLHRHTTLKKIRLQNLLNKKVYWSDSEDLHQMINKSLDSSVSPRQQFKN